MLSGCCVVSVPVSVPLRGLEVFGLYTCSKLIADDLVSVPLRGLEVFGQALEDIEDLRELEFPSPCGD